MSRTATTTSAITSAQEHRTAVALPSIEHRFVRSARSCSRLSRAYHRLAPTVNAPRESLHRPSPVEPNLECTSANTASRIARPSQDQHRARHSTVRELHGSTPTVSEAPAVTSLRRALLRELSILQQRATPLYRCLIRRLGSSARSPAPTTTSSATTPAATKPPAAKRLPAALADPT